MWQEGSVFFFKKKKQKIFGRLRGLDLSVVLGRRVFGFADGRIGASQDGEALKPDQFTTQVRP